MSGKGTSFDESLECLRRYLNLMKSLFLLTFFISFHVCSQTTTPSTTVQVSNSSTSSLYSMITEGTGGATVTEAIKVYIPIENGHGTPANKYYIHGSSNIPHFDTGFGTTFTSRIRHTVTVNNAGNTNAVYVYAAVIDKDDSSNMEVFSGSHYATVSSSSSGVLGTISANTNSSITFDLYLNNLCYAVADSSNYNCTNLDDNSTTETELEVDVLIFVTNSTINRFTQTSVSTYEASGTYYTYKLSNQTTTLANSEVSLSALKKGDGRVTAVYSGPTITEPYDVIGFQHSSGSISAYTPINNATGSIVSDNNGTDTDGSVLIKGLNNGTTYNMSVAFVNKWQFASPLSPSLAQTPESIETFLEKQSCYIISAGFQEEHPVLDYFRSFRDSVLLQNSFGRKFVEFYYKTAPKYAPYIYKSDLLSLLVRFLAKLIYFIMNHYLLVFGMLLLILLIPIKRLFSISYLK